MASLPGNWKSWVLSNLLNGTDAMELLKILLQNGFTFEACKNALGSNLPDSIQCNKDEAFYERLAQPKLLENLADYDAEIIASNKIQMVKINQFLDAQMCADLIELTKSKLRPSEIPAKPGTGYDDFRTSSTCDLPFTKQPLAKQIDQKIIDALGLGVGEREIIQAQHYAVGQEFKAHWDYFMPGSEDYKRFCLTNGGQRSWTFMIYLNDQCQGGETEFVELGMKFRPVTGTALIWNNLNRDGTPNPNTKHQAHPVTQGEKVIITKWFREDSYQKMK